MNIIYQTAAAVVAIAASAAAIDPLSAATTSCGRDVDQAIVKLTEPDGYGEQLTGAGLSGPDVMIQVYANMETGTFTVLQVRADGVFCMIASGDNFSLMPHEPAGEDM